MYGLEFSVLERQWHNILSRQLFAAMLAQHIYLCILHQDFLRNWRVLIDMFHSLCLFGALAPFCAISLFGGYIISLVLS